MKNKLILLMTPRTIIALIIILTIAIQSIITKNVDTILAGFGGAVVGHYFHDDKEQEGGGK